MQNKLELTKPKRFLSLSWKLLIGFTLIFAVTFAVAFFWFYQFATEIALKAIEENLVATMEGAVERIDGDAMQGLIAEGKPRADGYTDDPRYWDQVEWFMTVNHTEPRAFLYTYIKGKQPNEVVFLTSVGAAFDPPFGVKFREPSTDYPEPNFAGLITTTIQTTDRAPCTYGVPGCKLVPYRDRWGGWVTAYTPLKNTKGEVVAALGIDFDASYVFEVQQSILNQTGYAFLVTYLVLFVLVLTASRFFSRPLVALRHTAIQISEARYEEATAGLQATSSYRLFADETTSLSQVFEMMVAKVYEREQMLRQEVEVLKIVIDESKRQKEVGDIVESEFFKDLQVKARTMRRHTSPPSTPTAGPIPEEPKP